MNPESNIQIDMVLSGDSVAYDVCYKYVCYNDPKREIEESCVFNDEEHAQIYALLLEIKSKLTFSTKRRDMASLKKHL